jgi:hypothetical protein
MKMKNTGPYLFLFTLLFLLAEWIVQVIQTAKTWRDGSGSLSHVQGKFIARLRP